MDALNSFDRFGAPIVLGIAVALLALETKRPLRARVESRRRRLLRNVLLGLSGSAVVRLFVLTSVVSAAHFAQDHALGLDPTLARAGLPVFVSGAIVFLLLDASMYGWHRMNHERPILWRFHRVHHVDLDLDVSTALRFHPGELLLSAPFRVLQTLVLGPTPALALVYELTMQVATSFHHANLALPRSLERGLQRVIVTPRMHQIHHSVVPDQTASNWSVIFSFWDRMFASYRDDVSERDISIGVPEYRALDDVTIGKLLRQPFVPSHRLKGEAA